MTADLFTIALLTALIMVSPGPDLALVIRNTLLGGRAAGAWTSAGVLSGNLVHITYCAAGVSWLVNQGAVVFTALKWAGGAYLVYLGLQSLRSAPVESMPETDGANRRWWLQGVLNNLLNPKGALFYVGIFAVFLGPDTDATGRAAVIVTMIIVSTLFWIMLVSVLGVAWVRARLQAAGRVLNRLLGVVLIGLGIRLWLTEPPA